MAFFLSGLMNEWAASTINHVKKKKYVPCDPILDASISGEWLSETVQLGQFQNQTEKAKVPNGQNPLAFANYQFDQIYLI